jgi:hypothetical protein
MLADIVKSASGFPCEAVDDTGHLVWVDVPQIFEDDPETFLYISRKDGKLRLSDDGEFLFYFGGILRQKLEPGNDEKIAAIVHNHGLSMEDGEIVLWCDEPGLFLAIEKFMGLMKELAAREEALSVLQVNWIREQMALAAK